MVAITGQVGRAAIGTDAFQETDITGATMPVTKHNYLVTRVEGLRQDGARSISHRPHRSAGTCAD